MMDRQPSARDFNSYYEVSGSSVRFASVYQDAATEFAKGVYRSEEIILDIHEVQRTRPQPEYAKGKRGKR